MSGSPIHVLYWTHWEMAPEIPIGLIGLLSLYLAGLGPLRPRNAPSEAVPRHRVAAFAGGLLLLFLALTGPLDELADTFLFSAHMVQHLILILAVPPLLLFGTPGG